MEEKKLYKIGEIISVHGIKGKVDFAFTDDVFQRVETDCLFCRIEGLPIPFFVQSCSFKSNSRALLKFDGIDDGEAAKILLGVDVLFPCSKVLVREKKCDTWTFLMGFKVYGKKEGFIGNILMVDTQSTNILIHVSRTSGEDVLIPLNPDLVIAVDEKKRFLKMDLPEGLLTLNN